MIEKYHVDVPCGKSGDWEVSQFTVSESQSRLSFLTGKGRGVPEGTYTRLTYQGQVIMSDTPDEIYDHYRIIHKGQGKILIAGLGLGMVLNALAMKPETEKITVIEKSDDVINLVAGYYLDKYPGKIEIIKTDIFEWKPPKNAHYDYAWFDIWDGVCTDNLEEMKKLHRKFSRKATWKGSWSKEICEFRLKRGYL